MILVDSSVWIDYFRGHSNPQTELLDSLLGKEPVAVGDLIVTEVLQGFTGEREFNQAGRLARRLGAATGLAVNTRLLRRVTPTRTQTLLDRRERAENVRRAFAMRAGQSARGLAIVLVDDVLTTGATTNACARVLRRAGARKVCVWTVARGM